MTIPAEYRNQLTPIGEMGVEPPVSTRGTRCLS